jgi:plastocyanin
MKRLLGVVALAALALAVTIGSGGDVGPARAASTKCVWIKHTKRVVRHVKRHGKVHKVVKVKHYVTCRKVALPEEAPPAPTTSPTSGGSTSPSGGSTSPTPTPEPEANAVSITANDRSMPYTFIPSRKVVRPGALTVQLINKGEDEHTMDMEKVGAGNAPEGPIILATAAPSDSQSTPTTVTVEAGTYRLWCTLPNHAAMGMETTITVE